MNLQMSVEVAGLLCNEFKQVDGPEDQELEDPSKFQSVGIQVEEEHG